VADWGRLRRWASTAPSRLLYLRRDPARQLADEGIFDLEYYRAQFWDPDEEPRSLRQAVRHYISHGRDAGFGFSPFVEPEWYEGYYPDPAWRLSLDVAFVRDWTQGVAPSPLYKKDGGPFGAARGIARATRAGRWDDRLIGDLDARTARATLLDRLRRSRRNPPNQGSRSGVDWEAVVSSVDARVPNRVSVLVPTYQDWRMTAESVQAVLDRSGEADLEILIIENGSRPSVFRLLTVLFLFEPRVRIIACDVNTNFSGGMNLGIAASTGEYIVLLNNDAVVSSRWLPPLLQKLKDDPNVLGVQPALLYPHSRRIQAAGTIFLGEGVLPWHFLAGHPVEDLERVRDLRFTAITAAIMVTRARDLLHHRGFDEEFINGYEDVDLCLRMVQESGGYFLVVPESEAVHPEGSSEGRSLKDHVNRQRFLEIWRGRMPAPEGWRYREIGMHLDTMRADFFASEVPIMVSSPQVSRPDRRVSTGPGAGLPALRWMLALTTPVGEQRVEVLKTMLNRLGQEVVTIHGGAFPSDGLDDVLVAFDPNAPFTPRSAAYNVLLATDATPLREASPVWEAVLCIGSPDPDVSLAVTEGGVVHEAAAFDAPGMEATMISIIETAYRFRQALFG